MRVNGLILFPQNRNLLIKCKCVHNQSLAQHFHGLSTALATFFVDKLEEKETQLIIRIPCTNPAHKR